MCSGVYTAEMALAYVTKVIRDSRALPYRVAFQCAAVWVLRLELVGCLLCFPRTLLETGILSCFPVASKELDPKCHQCIRDHHVWSCQVAEADHELPCMFTDVMSLVPPKSFDPSTPFVQKKSDIYSSPLVLEQKCLSHNKSCRIPAVDYDCSGLPCTDNSRAKCSSKQGRQLYEGPTGPIFITWALRLKRSGVKLAVLENTPATGHALGMSR